MSSTKVDDRTLVVSVATVGLISLLECAAGSKSGRRDNASVTTLNRPGLYSTEKLYSATKDSHIAIFARGVGYLRPCMVRINDERFIYEKMDHKFSRCIFHGKEFLVMYWVIAFSWLQLTRLVTDNALRAVCIVLH
ncbi:hypothetical protein CCR75_006232 [Bremia lactucae]|uniref:Uncharacterized protein n=1 Tax=Bremia lactucae TaxID=4779 RepID=A0A976ILQ9_BRELC|nr:hypothetical protein CCR75_006232 [Bremia lactucae]